MNNELIFLAEQDGEVERQFKRKLCTVFLKTGKPLRAYLALAQSGQNDMPHVVLCLRIPGKDDFVLLNQCAEVFKEMFAQSQHLDMAFITEQQEQTLRTLCCPFYTSVDFNVSAPDFYLFSHEGYNLDDEPRACYMRKHLYGDRQDGFMLCDISPAIIGQPFGLGGEDIHQVILANRLLGDSLFPISHWPVSVYVTRIVNDEVLWNDVVEESDHELIAWASVYQDKTDITL